jgi:hypothetical protein
MDGTSTILETHIESRFAREVRRKFSDILEFLKDCSWSNATRSKQFDDAGRLKVRMKRK